MLHVHYKPAEPGYFERRSLRRHARVLQLWALGVGAVISGDFFGWNFGLIEGGFGGMIAALAIMTVLFLGLCCGIAEMSPALPHAGGAYSFARTAMGPWGGYITGLAENMEYILTPAVIVVGIGGYLGTVSGTPPGWAPFWWLACYSVFAAFKAAGVETSFRVSLAITFCALTVLLVFFAGALPRFDLHHWALGHGAWFPRGWPGILHVLPFALWVYLGIEQLPLAAEEAHDPARDMPRAMMLGLATLVVFAFLTIVLNAGIAPGAVEVGRSDEPLFLAFRTIFGNGATARIVALAGCTGLLASFHAILFAYARQIYSLSRAGYFPVWLSVTHDVRQTPERALMAGSILGYCTALTIYFAGQKSPVGIAGAIIAAVIALATLGALFLSADYRPGVLGAVCWFLAGIVWFAWRRTGGRVHAPEEQFAQEATSPHFRAP